MKQAKIAISIDPKLLQEVEKTIDGISIKSRSQAIEYLLRKSLSGGVSTAVILAGGNYGEDKAMRRLMGKPVLQHLIEWMRGYGIDNYLIAISAGETSIRAYFGDGRRFNTKLTYLLESIPTGTAGAVSGSRSIVGQTFIVANCDSIFDFNLSNMISHHLKSGKHVTIAVKETDNPSEYGSVQMEGNDIIGFHEKSVRAPSKIVSVGLYIMNREVFSYLPNKGSLEELVFPRLARERMINGYIFTSKWKDTERLK